MHIVRDLVLGLEGDLSYDVGEVSVGDSHVHFAEDDLAADFDAVMQQAAAEDNDDTIIERVGEDIATNLVSTATKGGADFH